MVHSLSLLFKVCSRASVVVRGLSLLFKVCSRASGVVHGLFEGLLLVLII